MIALYTVLVVVLLALLVLAIGGAIHDPQINLMQGGAASKDRLARVAHNHEVVGSNPTPATNWPVVGPKSPARLGCNMAVSEATPRSLVAQPANGGSEISPASFIEPKDLMDEPLCAWCMKEQAIKAQPHESHGICQRHKDMMLAEAKRFSRSQFA